VGAAQARGRASLADEALHDLRIAQYFRLDELHCDDLVEVQLARRDDVTHRAGSEDALHPKLVRDDIARVHWQRVRFHPGWVETRPGRA
jgi:hypothetical protein